MLSKIYKFVQLKMRFKSIIEASSFTLLLFLLFAVTNTNAQNQLEQEVKVVKPYEPVISDAFKISELAKINDTIKVEPKFEYDLTPRRYDTGFKPKLIKPANLSKEKLPKLYHCYVKAGFGSHLSPLLEAYVGSNRDELWKWGGSFTHLSSHGKVKTLDDKKVYAGFSKTDANAKARRFFENDQSVGVDIDFNNRINYYYGYNPSIITPINQAPLKKNDIEKQKANVFNMQADWSTNYLDSVRMNFKIQSGFQTFSALNGISQNAFNLQGGLNRFYEKEFLGIDIGIKSYSTSGYVDTALSLIMNFNPWIGAYGDKWEVVAGVKTYFNASNNKYGFYPRLSMHYNIIDYFLIPYFELGGTYQENNYKKIFYENPYIKQDLAVLPTDNSLEVAFGFRGNISSKISFNLRANYSTITDQYFYVNDTLFPLQNKFNVVYDDISMFRMLGEIAFTTKDDLSFRLKGNYYKYNLQTEEYAWHKPDFELSLDVQYVIQKKIILDANFFAVSSRFAKEYINGVAYAKPIDGMFDVNLGIEYRLSKQLSSFLNLNNIANQQYTQWNNYPTQRFNFMAGVTYSFF